MVWWCACAFYRILKLIVFFLKFFHIFNLDLFLHSSECVVGTLWAQLLLFFHASILWKCICSRYIVSATPPTVLDGSFWNFTGILIIVYRYSYACGLYRTLNLYAFTFFTFLTYCFAWFWVCSGNLVSATPPTVLYRFFWNFTGILVMVWRYACAFYIILK